jgi:hypothetical protein
MPYFRFTLYLVAVEKKRRVTQIFEDDKKYPELDIINSSFNNDKSCEY